MYARYRPTIRYPLPKFFYSKEENLSSTKYQHYVLYPTVVNARRAGKRVVSKVRMMLLFRLADGYLDDMDGELVLSHVICPFRLFLFFAVLLCGGGGGGEKKKILGKTLFSLLGSSSTFVAIWDAHLLSLAYTYSQSA